VSLFVSIANMESKREDQEKVQPSKDFECEVCSKSFKLRFHLNQHLKVHKEKKTHKFSPATYIPSLIAFSVRVSFIVVVSWSSEKRPISPTRPTQLA